MLVVSLQIDLENRECLPHRHLVIHSFRLEFRNNYDFSVRQEQNDYLPLLSSVVMIYNISV